MKKTIIIALMGLFSTGIANAQTDYEMPDIYGLEEYKPKRVSFVLEAGIAKEVEFGFRVQRNFNKYISWDIIHAKYAYDYRKVTVYSSYKRKYNLNLHEITLTTGVRAYTPSITQYRIKGFMALDLGYGRGENDHSSKDNFVLDYTLGAYVCKGLYVGYGLGYLKPSHGSHKDHLLRVGYEF